MHNFVQRNRLSLFVIVKHLNMWYRLSLAIQCHLVLVGNRVISCSKQSAKNDINHYFVKCLLTHPGFKAGQERHWPSSDNHRH